MDKIQSIKKLENFGIFQNYTSQEVNDFGKYNLFYGWNGSGKSTLSYLFYCIERRAHPSRFPNAKFNLTLCEQENITEKTILNSSLNIYVFNKDFIDDNISWNNIVKSILLVDKEKIEERKKLEELKKELANDKQLCATEVTGIQTAEHEISMFKTNSARNIKTSLSYIDTADRYYLNYDKRKFEAFIKNNFENIKSSISLLSDEKIAELIDTAKPTQKTNISFTLQKTKAEMWDQAQERLNVLLSTSIVSQTIERLVKHSDIMSWVETGIKLHEKHHMDKCEFCGNNIKIERIKELEAHFNDNYKDFQARLVSANHWLKEKYIQLPILPASASLYDELQMEYEQSSSLLRASVEKINNILKEWQEILNTKIANPLETNLSIEAIPNILVDDFNSAIDKIEGIIYKHNHKSNNFAEETKKAKEQLELHYATEAVNDFNLYERKDSLLNRKQENNTLKSTITGMTREITRLESSLANEGLGADKFNKSLHRFLGRSELELRFSPTKKGYEIIRNQSDLAQGTLSEGEKTAIAFVYFITKLKENDNKIEDTIVVIDDPISSFDSTHLFHAYSFLKENCQSINQLFVFTHNFTFFKLIRDWLKKKNKKNKEAKAIFYTIEANTDTPRRSIIKNSDNSLIEYNSEYHYIFSRLHKYKSHETLTREEAFLTANLSRKLLESFFSFKFPRYRSDFAQLMDCGMKICDGIDEITKEKIYRFINKYSHSAVIEMNEDSFENILGESQNIINDIFNWIREVDATHYREMLEVL